MSTSHPPPKWPWHPFQCSRLPAYMPVTLTASTWAGGIVTTAGVEIASSNGLISTTSASYMTQRCHAVSTQVDGTLELTWTRHLQAIPRVISLTDMCSESSQSPNTDHHWFSLGSSSNQLWASLYGVITSVRLTGNSIVWLQKKPLRTNHLQIAMMWIRHARLFVNCSSQWQRRPSHVDIARPIFRAGMRSATASTTPSNALLREPRPDLPQRNYFLSLTRRGSPAGQRL